jgi:RNA polymerase sigma-70 factor (ECF subfamily)
MTLDEVAHEVGLSVSGVRKRLRTLRDRLPSQEGAAS